MVANGFTIRPLVSDDLETHIKRLTQIYLDAFTIGSYSHNAGKENEPIAIEYLHKMIRVGGEALLAFDDGELAYPDYPIGFLFATPLTFDYLMLETSIPTKFNVERCRYIAELAVDRGHRRRGIARGLITTYVSSQDTSKTDAVLVRTNESNPNLLKLYDNAGFQKLDDTPLQHGYVKKRYFCAHLVDPNQDSGVNAG
ncbi:MAG: GNAT family N-acetyltransferase [Symploca sp. SIO2G7]|nr:GNAT family N-acetyltransferase [Symploca sp. SIO2G7]